MELKNSPTLLPAPYWYEPEQAGYLSFYHDVNGNMQQLEVGMELTEDYYEVYMEVKNVTMEDLDIYINYIEDMAVDLSWNEEEQKWLIFMPDYVLQIGIEEEKSTVGIMFSNQDATFAPIYYFQN